MHESVMYFSFFFPFSVMYLRDNNEDVYILYGNKRFIWHCYFKVKSFESRPGQPVFIVNILQIIGLVIEYLASPFNYRT